MPLNGFNRILITEVSLLVMANLLQRQLLLRVASLKVLFSHRFCFPCMCFLRNTVSSFTVTLMIRESICPWDLMTWVGILWLDVLKFSSPQWKQNGDYSLWSSEDACLNFSHLWNHSRRIWVWNKILQYGNGHCELGLLKKHTALKFDRLVW